MLLSVRSALPTAASRQLKISADIAPASMQALVNMLSKEVYITQEVCVIGQIVLLHPSHICCRLSILEADGSRSTRALATFKSA